MSKVFKAVGNAISGVVKAVVNVVSAVVKAVVNVVSSVINFVVQPFMGMLGGSPSMPDAAGMAREQQGVLIPRQGSDEQIPVVYGYRKLAGVTTFAETGSSKNKYLYVVYVFSEGIVEGLREVFIDDWQLPVNLTSSLNAGQVVDVPGPGSATNRYGGRVRMIWNPGVYYNNPSASPVGAYLKTNIFAESPSFTNQMNFNGLATLAVRYEWLEIKDQEVADNNPFTGGIPKVQVCLMGRRIAALDATASTYAYESAPVRYSTNPAEILLDYLRNPRYGKGLGNDDIDWTSWKKSADKCNTTVNYVTGQSFAGPILTCNYIVNTSQTIFANVKTLLPGFRAYMPYVQGKYKLRIDDAGNDLDILSGVATVVMTATTKPYLKNQFTGNVCDVVGNITYTGIDKTSKYTSYSVTYVDPDQKWANQEVVYPESEEERQRYITQDGGRENPGSATFPTLTNYAMAKDMARLLFLKSRRQETLSLTVSSEGLELEPGDNIRVEGNILNFNTGSLIVPWRVVSVKINDNMTVDLGLVKNPDDIYPHSRYNEEDTVDAVYVPKGSDIYYPGSENRENPIGLVPPRSAPFPPVVPPDLPPQVPPPPYVPPAVYVPPNTPNPVTPSPPASPTPPSPPPVPPFAAALKLKSSRAVSTGTNWNFNLVFTQPQDGLYSYSIVWWRYNRFSPWTEVRIDTLPGAGGDIPWALNFAGYGQYDYYVRSFATDGRASNQVLVGQIAFPQNVADLNPSLSGIATAQQTQVSEGWVLPASQVAAGPRYDDNIDYLELRPKLSSGSPLNPRRMRVVINQNTNTYVNTPNLLISGVRVYYKYSADTYYAYEDYKFSSLANYAPGAQVAFDLAGDFGAPGTGNTLAQYDFMFRLTYVDGRAALKQIGPTRCNVETFTGLNNFVAIGTGPAGSAATDFVVNRVSSQAIPAGFSLKTVDEDPNKAYASGAAIIPNIRDIRANNTLPILQWQFNPPTNTKWRGYKIRFRAVVPGTNQAFAELDTGFALNTTTGFLDYTINGGAFKVNTFYDWVITAQFYDTASATVKDATTSLVCRASITAGLGTQYNIVPGILNTVMTFTQQETTTALNTLRTAFPALPTPDPKSWIKRQAQTYDPAKIGRLQLAGVYNQADVARAASGTSFNLNTYYEFKFQMPNDTFDQVIIYRRVFSKTGDARTSVGSTAKYYELGQWEKIAINRALITKGSDGLYTVYVRGPISPEAFEINYQRPGYATKTLLKKQYGAGSYPDATTTGKLTGIYPYYGAGNTDWASGTPTRWCEFLFSMRDAGVDSTKALRLRDFYAESSGTGFKTDVDGFLTGSVSKLDIVTLSDFNGYEAGYLRNLNEAISTYVFQQYLQFGIQEPDGAAFFSPNYVKTPNITQFGANPTIFIIPPVNGDPVY
jgi:hypothetical protein